MPMKFNPFQPNKIVTPGMFTGRVDELRAIEQCLFQAKNGNPSHFLLQGERGIGKSSLLLYVDVVAQGQLPTFSDDKVNFITASVDLGGCQTQVEIIRAIARGIKRSVSEHQTTKEAAKKLWDWLTNWEVLGVRFHKDQENIDPQDIADELIAKISDFCIQSQGQVDGVLILLDEADQPSVDAGLGQFVKLFTERLTRKGCNNVLIGIAGLPVILAKLRDSHESAPRIFQTMLLDPLETEERKTVIRTGLNQAELKNGFAVGISDEAINLVADLSEGYPHFVQQFAYSAFEHDDDNLIDVQDVLGGAYKENGAIAQLGRKYFDEMYFGKIGSDDYRRVLDAMAEHSDGWVARKDIISESGVKATTVNNAMNALKVRNIVVADESRQGFYRLPTKSFAAWINAIKSVTQQKDAEAPSLFD